MPDLTAIELVILGIVTFFVTIFSGIAGGGGGFVVTPLLIFLGLTPAQAVATGKLFGLTAATGTLSGIHRVPKRSKKLLFAIMFLSVAVGLAAPAAIVRLDAEIYQRLIGFLLLAMIPVLIVKKVGHLEHQTSRPRKLVGLVFLIASLGLQAVFSGGLNILVNIVLMAFIGMSALEANITKRYTQLFLNTVIILGLLSSGLIIWKAALVGMVAAGLGGFIGGKIAVKRGNTFVMSFFIVIMLVSAVALLFE